ncbi:hypothetical protein IKG20_02570 [Candidatus Saccharibacteria bacterium]|nr:hypothetical protein [Candidatus Saccharibacteria bacterium]
MNHTAVIRQYIIGHPDEAIDASYIHAQYFSLVRYDSILKVFSRFVEDGTLKQISRGVYVPALVSDEEVYSAIVRFYVDSYNGMFIGETLYSQLGLSDYDSGKIQVYTKRLPNGKTKNISNIKLIGADIVFDDAAKNLVSVLEAIEHSRDIVDIDYVKYVSVREELITDYSDMLFREITSAVKYQRSTFATFAEILDKLQIAHTCII